ncbi:hypothetical protein Nepgr_018162 [Nepenthes gracilis]|uniref:RING-type domain-containing protein n=1 Tax=Nepenthes gracilis TaxID=150966 RepID=A0AAD3XU19_NEPGR|nr:hypothetical protein Nepgr_018162 [Nepenthes gracilis]
MTAAMRLLSATAGSPIATEQPNTENAKSDYVVILAALSCAIICAVGLALVARCARLHRRLSSSAGPSHSVPALLPPPPPGLKKKSLQLLPTATYASGAGGEGKISDCAICLTDFCDGDVLRVLPQCGHVFHVSCIDMWLSCHSSCPSCRELVMVVPRCKRCGGSPAAAEIDQREICAMTKHDFVNGFLP